KSIRAEADHDFGPHDLDGDHPIVPQVATQVNNGHSPLTQFALHGIPTLKGLGKLGGEIRHGSRMGWIQEGWKIVPLPNWRVCWPVLFWRTKGRRQDPEAEAGTGAGTGTEGDAGAGAGLNHSHS